MFGIRVLTIWGSRKRGVVIWHSVGAMRDYKTLTGKLAARDVMRFIWRDFLQDMRLWLARRGWLTVKVIDESRLGRVAEQTR